ncbi:tetratricopeptide repeat protein [Nostoc sp. PCC 7524]|uniref:tetratricopeptide repeat protein n=1 Tax=Nostoc sp. (strain ATCC 29411 / PCC 7524) TaxID=28072 RepID=UPI00029F3F18|nr:tetratricopeptide repeat protein [Nostoc sp. PCC 7524]AFY47905.1 tetratricopeptide repeat protein [Nostoc sp. PCC 7524]
MQQNRQVTSLFVQPLSYLSLSIIAVIGVFPITAQAQEQPAHKLACEEVLNNRQQQSQQKQVQKLAQFTDSSQERSQLIQQANELYNRRDFKSAAESLCQLIKKYPRDAFGHFQLGNVFFRRQQPEVAISSYQEAIRLNSQYALAYNGIGVVYASQTRWQDAIEVYEKALQINPNYGDALINFGQALWQVNRKDEARASLEKALNIFKSQKRNEKVYQVEQILQQIKTLDNPNIS